MKRLDTRLLQQLYCSILPYAPFLEGVACETAYVLLHTRPAFGRRRCYSPEIRVRVVCVCVFTREEGLPLAIIADLWLHLFT